MTDEERPDINAGHEHGRIDQVDLQSEMQRSYLDYAMAVIVGRALPDVRDGLKPVHRRVIYGMYDGGFRPDKSFSKCARVVGEVMGQTTRTVTRRSTMPWSVSCSRGRCATRSRRGRETSALPATWVRQPPGTPRRRWLRSRSRWCATSKRTPSTSRPTTTGR